MSGMVSPCNLTNYWLQDKEGKNFRLIDDSIDDIWFSEHRKKLIEAHDNNIQHSACQVCWNDESAGIESTRQKFNKQLKDIATLEEQPRIMIVKPGNLCNVACRSCNADTSSAWYKDSYNLHPQNKTYKEWLKFYGPHKKTYNDNQSLEKIFDKWQKNIIFWDLYGGEPLLIPLTYRILSSAIESGTAGDKSIGIHTNGTIYNSKLVDILKNFKKVNFGYSIDAIGNKNDYIRKNSRWEEIIKNLENYIADFSKHSNITITVRCSPTPWNVYYLDEIYDYFNKKNIKISFRNIVNDRPYNDISYLPIVVKNKIIDKLLSYSTTDTNYQKSISNVIKWLKFSPRYHEKLQNAFIVFNNKLDTIRKESFKDIFPEFDNLLKEKD
jgi:hypothetical protein